MVASMPRKLGGNRVCSRVLCPGCPRIQCRNQMPALYVSDISCITTIHMVETSYPLIEENMTNTLFLCITALMKSVAIKSSAWFSRLI